MASSSRFGRLFRFSGFLGVISAKTGGAEIFKPTVRVVFWGALAMAVTAGIGALVGRAV
jgi:VIT1/CCC1 family predicted Fe2+/Mn2+ transporter